MMGTGPTEQSVAPSLASPEDIERPQSVISITTATSINDYDDTLSNVTTPRGGSPSHFEQVPQHHGHVLDEDLPPTYDESQAAHTNLPRSGTRDVLVYRTEVPHVSYPPPEHADSMPYGVNDAFVNSDGEEIPSPDQPRASALLYQALSFTNNPLPSTQVYASPLSRPVAVPSLYSPSSDSVRFARLYSRILQSNCITASQWASFIDGLNAICIASSFNWSHLDSSVPLNLTAGSDIPRSEWVPAFIQLSNAKFFGPRGLRMQITTLPELAELAKIPQHHGFRHSMCQSAVTASSSGLDSTEESSVSAALEASKMLNPYLEPLVEMIPTMSRDSQAMDSVARGIHGLSVDEKAPIPTPISNTSTEPTVVEATQSDPTLPQFDSVWTPFGPLHANTAPDQGHSQSHGPPTPMVPWGPFRHGSVPNIRGMGGRRGHMGMRPFGRPWLSHHRGPFQAHPHQQGLVQNDPRNGGPFPPGSSRNGPSGPTPLIPTPPIVPNSIPPITPPSAPNRSQSWAEWGRGWEKWGEEYGKRWQEWGDAYGKTWEDYGKQWQEHMSQKFGKQSSAVKICLPGQSREGCSSKDSVLPKDNGKSKRAADQSNCPWSPSKAEEEIQKEAESDEGEDWDDAASDISFSSYSSDSSDDTFVEDPEAIFASKVAAIEEMAEKARSVGKKSESTIEKDKLAAIHKAEAEKTKRELRIEKKIRKREMRKQGRIFRRQMKEWKRGMKRDWKAKGLTGAEKHKAKKERIQEFKNMCIEFEKVKAEIAKMPIDVPRERQRRRHRRRGRDADDAPRGRHGRRGGRHGRGRGSRDDDVAHEDAEYGVDRPSQMLWIVVRNLE